MQRPRPVAAILPPAFVLAASPSLAAPQIGPEILLTNVPGAASIDVPGMPGVQFSFAGESDFGEVKGSPNGNWILTGPIPDPADPGDTMPVLLVNGVAVLALGDVAPWDPSGRPIDRIRGYDVNDAGDFVVDASLEGPGLGDQVVRQSGGQFFVDAEQGDPVSTIPGATLGSSASQHVILRDGSIGFMADNLAGVPSSRSDAVFLDGELLLHSGITVPTGQANGGTQTFQNIFFNNRFWVSDDGQHWAAITSLNGNVATDEGIALDGHFVLQEGSVIPGSGFTSAVRDNGFFGGFMDASGNWYARGKNVDDVAWLVRNGDVIAKEGDPVVPGSTELVSGRTFTATFGLVTGNSLGQYVYVAETDEPDRDRNEVVVRDGSRIVARIGDPLDIDENGVFDDDAFILFFADRNGHLADDGMWITEVGVRDSAGDEIGYAILRIDTNGSEIGTNYCTANPNSTGTPSGLGARGSTSVAANDLTLVASGLPTSQFGFFLNADQRGFAPNIGVNGSGNLCLGGGIGRYNRAGEILSSGANGSFELSIDLTSIPRPSSTEAAAPGQTWRFQAWYRDSNANGPSSNLTRGLE
ncbi:MAG: hypothetical protein AAFZ87_07495, partial [Planctomycetota bacterium]